MGHFTFILVLIFCAVNFAVALAKEFKLKVGLLDADIYGPSIPTMMNLHAKPEVSEDMKMIPIENHGVRCMSIGFLVDKDAPIVWRGNECSREDDKGSSLGKS